MVTMRFGRSGTQTGPTASRTTCPAQAAAVVPEMRDAYPEPSMFGVLPAHGLYIRHARRIDVRGLEIRTELPDVRPPVVIEDARAIRITRLAATGTPVIRDSRDISTEII